MTDNGNGYRSHQHTRCLPQLGIKHLFTEPYRPRTNGKAERFIRTLTLGWAYGARSSQARTPPGAARLARPLQLHRDRTESLAGQTPPNDSPNGTT